MRPTLVIVPALKISQTARIRGVSNVRQVAEKIREYIAAELDFIDMDEFSEDRFIRHGKLKKYLDMRNEREAYMTAFILQLHTNDPRRRAAEILREGLETKPHEFNGVLFEHAQSDKASYNAVIEKGLSIIENGEQGQNTIDTLLDELMFAKNLGLMEITRDCLKKQELAQKQKQQNKQVLLALFCGEKSLDQAQMKHLRDVHLQELFDIEIIKSIQAYLWQRIEGKITFSSAVIQQCDEMIDYVIRMPSDDDVYNLDTHRVSNEDIAQIAASYFILSVSSLNTSPKQAEEGCAKFREYILSLSKLYKPQFVGMFSKTLDAFTQSFPREKIKYLEDLNNLVDRPPVGRVEEGEQQRSADVKPTKKIPPICYSWLSEPQKEQELQILPITTVVELVAELNVSEKAARSILPSTEVAEAKTLRDIRKLLASNKQAFENYRDQILEEVLGEFKKLTSTTLNSFARQLLRRIQGEIEEKDSEIRNAITKGMKDEAYKALLDILKKVQSGGRGINILEAMLPCLQKYRDLLEYKALCGLAHTFNAANVVLREAQAQQDSDPRAKLIELYRHVNTLNDNLKYSPGWLYFKELILHIKIKIMECCGFRGAEPLKIEQKQLMDRRLVTQVSRGIARERAKLTTKEIGENAMQANKLGVVELQALKVR